MALNSPQELGARLDSVNTESLYDLMSQIFVPFANNLLINSHMELYALGIQSVKQTIGKYMNSGTLPPNLLHVQGLNDYHPMRVFLLLDEIGTTKAKLCEAIGFSEEEIIALKKILLQITRNQVALMEQDLKRVET